jgi:RNA polymerase sigma-32 factor
MEQRMGGRDLSLDAPVGDEGGNAHVDLVPSPSVSQDLELADKEEAGIINSRVQVALCRLDPRERFIIERRVMNERPMTLKELGQHFGFSRERARQLEIRAKDKLKGELSELVAQVQPSSVAA